jgi:hypothetical protein
MRGFCDNIDEIRPVAFLATGYNEVLLGYQPGQVVEQWGRGHRSEDHLCPYLQTCLSTVQPLDPADSLRELR